MKGHMHMVTVFKKVPNPVRDYGKGKDIFLSSDDFDAFVALAKEQMRSSVDFELQGLRYRFIAQTGSANAVNHFEFYSNRSKPWFGAKA